MFALARFAFLLSVIILPLATIGARIRKDDNPLARDIHIVNGADVKVDIFWVHPTTREEVKSLEAGIIKGMDTIINSYVGHEFKAYELKGKKKTECRGPDGVCRTTTFHVTQGEDQRFTIEKEFTVKYEDSRTRALDKAKQVSEECPMPGSDGEGLPDLESWADCLQRKINATLDVSKQEIEFQAGVRKSMGRKLVDYACNDEDFPASVSQKNKTLNVGLGPIKNPKIQTLFDTDTTKIILLDNFVARSQCHWVKEKSQASSEQIGKLSWTAITDVAINGIVARMYKALEQILEYQPEESFVGLVDRKKEETDPSTLFEVFVDTADDAKAMKRHLAEEHEKQPLMASFILFCDTPKQGGAVHFPKAGIHVKPTPGQALLISYMNPKTGERADDAFTSEYVECPIADGSRASVRYDIPAP